MTNTCESIPVNKWGSVSKIARATNLQVSRVSFLIRKKGAPSDPSAFSAWLDENPTKREKMRRLRDDANRISKFLKIKPSLALNYLRRGMPSSLDGAYDWVFSWRCEKGQRLSAALRGRTGPKTRSWTHEAGKLCGISPGSVLGYAQRGAPRSPACFWLWFSYRKKNPCKRAQKPRPKKITPPEIIEARRIRRNQKAKEYQAKLRAAGLGYRRNRETARKWWRNRYHSDPQFRLKNTLKARMHKALKSQSAKKTGRTISLLGCSLQFFRDWLEKQFQPGMTWENRGKGWHIDHIKATSLFDLTKPEQQAECFHYTNLQPLWGPDNIRKSNKIFYYVRSQGQIAL